MSEERTFSVPEIVDRATEAITAALLAADSEHVAVGACPFCGEMLTIANRHAYHFPPLCPGWARFIEEWTPSAEAKS